MTSLCYLNLLPEAIYPLIREYLVYYRGESNEDILGWRNFLNSSKTLFHRPYSVIKSKYIYYNLSLTYSKAYLSSDIRTIQSSILTNILSLHSLIETPISQIRLNSHYFFQNQKTDIGPVHSLRVSYQALNDISCLKGKIQCFIVENCDGLHNITPLIGTTFVHLNSGTVKDVRPLQHCKIVVLEFLDSVIDISSLSNLNTLVLVGCSKVCDVSMLGGLHTLSIEDCPKITDVSALGGVAVLFLNTEGKFTKFVPFDNKIRHLMCPVDYLPLLNQFQNKHKTSLSLIQAPSGFTLFSLKGWKDVSLLASSHIKIDESIMQPAQKSGEKKLTEEQIDEFQLRIRKLELLNLPELSLIHSLLYLYYLKIEGCHALKEINFQTFLQLKQCWLAFNLNLALIHVEGSIERLTISNSHIGGMEIKLLKRLKQLYIEKCSLGGNIQFYNDSGSSSCNDANFIQVIKSGRFVIHNNS